MPQSTNNLLFPSHFAYQVTDISYHWTVEIGNTKNHDENLFNTSIISILIINFVLNLYSLDIFSSAYVMFYDINLFYESINTT